MCTRDSVFDVLSACLVSFHHLVATNLYPTNHERERERESCGWRHVGIVTGRSPLPRNSRVFTCRGILIVRESSQRSLDQGLMPHKISSIVTDIRRFVRK